MGLDASHLARLAYDFTFLNYYFDHKFFIAKRTDRLTIGVVFYQPNHCCGFAYRYLLCKRRDTALAVGNSQKRP